MQRSEAGDVPAVLQVDLQQNTADEEREIIASVRRRSTWARLRRQHVAMASLIVIILFVLAAIFAPVLAPHDPNFQFDNGLSASGAPLGSSAQFPLGTDNLGRCILSRLLYGSRLSLGTTVVAAGLILMLNLLLVYRTLSGAP